jgi:hypothetical protein
MAFTYTDILVECFFTKDEIAQLKEVHDDSTRTYLSDLNMDSFAYDFTQDDLANAVTLLMPNIYFSDKAKKEISYHLYNYFL